MADKRVLIIGDFIAASYLDEVRDDFARRADQIEVEVVDHILERGDSEELLQCIDSLLERHDPDVVHFNTGLADVAYHPDEGYHTVSLGQYESNLQDVTELLVSRLGNGVVFATTTYTHEPRYTAHGHELERNNRDIEEYNIAAREVMLSEDVLINHLDYVISEDDGEMLAEDGMSLSDAGQSAAARSVFESIWGIWH